MDGRRPPGPFTETSQSLLFSPWLAAALALQCGRLTHGGELEIDERHRPGREHDSQATRRFELSAVMSADS